MKRLLIIFIITSIFCSNALCQNRYGIYAGAGYGFIAPHHEYMQYIVTQHIYHFEIGASLKFNDKTAWFEKWRKPETMLTYCFTDLGDNNSMGNAHSLLTLLNIPVFDNQNHRIFYTMGIGVAWLTKPFDAENNYYQTAIASHLNAHVRIGLGYCYKIEKSNPIWLKTSLMFDHFSNGCFTEPNLGLNLITIGAGASYYFGDESHLANNFDNKLKKWYGTVFLTAGVKQYAAYDEKRFFIGSVYANYNYRLNYKRALGMGADFVYDKSVAPYYLNTAGIVNERTFRMGVHLNQDLYFGNLIICLQVGAYLVNPKKDDGIIYDRVGLKYMITKNLMAGITLKSHISVADNFELSLGYRF